MKEEQKRTIHFAWHGADDERISEDWKRSAEHLYMDTMETWRHFVVDYVYPHQAEWMREASKVCDLGAKESLPMLGEIWKEKMQALVDQSNLLGPCPEGFVKIRVTEKLDYSLVFNLFGHEVILESYMK